MLYKPGIAKIIERHKAFWTGDILDRVPLRVRFTLDSMHDSQWSDALQSIKSHFSYWERYAQLRADLEDDEVPAANLDMGPAFMPAVMGGRISFSGGTSWSEPIIHSKDDLPRLRSVRFDNTNPVIAQYLERAAYFSEHSRGKMAVGVAMLTGGGDISGFLRGLTESYTDMAEDPEWFRQLLEICTDAWIKMQRLQFQAVPSISGGYCDNYGICTPGKSTYFANDLSTCVSAGTYRSLMFEQDSRMAAALDCPWIHTHSIQARLIPQFLDIPRIRGIHIVNDGSSGPGLDEVFPYAQLVQKWGKCLLLRKYSMEELMPYLPRLSPKGLMIDTQCGSLSQAKSIVKDFTAGQFMKFA